MAKNGLKKTYSGIKDSGCLWKWALGVLLCLRCVALAAVCPAAVVCLLTRLGCPAFLVVPSCGVSGLVLSF